MDWSSFIVGFCSAFALSAGFVIFAMWHNKRYPLLPPDNDPVEHFPQWHTVKK